jgi:hypothetical protein
MNPNVSNLEGNQDIDYGDANINRIFKELDAETKKKLFEDFPIEQSDDKDMHIGVLKNIGDPEIQATWEKMTEQEKQFANSKNIRDKYLVIRGILNQKKIKEQKKTPVKKVSSSSEAPVEFAEVSKEKARIAIIIPFRDLEEEKKRTHQLNTLVEYFTKYLKNDDYKIFVVEQNDDARKFNRGQLLNIGFEEAEKEGYSNFIFHDADLLPSDELKEYYEFVPENKPIHIAAVWDRYGGNDKYFGGIVAFNKQMFNRINGYPNNFWGWGGEDDELFNRTRKFYNIMKVRKGSIRDLEELNLEQKLDYLRENDLKFMQKKEALAEHEKTWKNNGLNTLKFKKISTSSCGEKCEKITVELDNIGNVTIQAPESKAISVMPQELLQEEEIEEQPKNVKETPQKRFEELVKSFYNNNPFVSNRRSMQELEVKFGTKGIKPLMRNDYDNVIKKLKSLGFKTENSFGLYSLRVNCEFLDNVTGRFKMSDIRTEINDIYVIENYCRSNDIKSIYAQYPTSINFINKRIAAVMNGKQVVQKFYPVDFDDFNFRVTYNNEDTPTTAVTNFIMENWRKSKKEFRLINRVTFKHPDYPFKVDISIVKYGNRMADKFGRENKGRIIPVYTLDESNVFKNQETYEIEIEVDNYAIGPATKFNSSALILESLRKVIKFVLGGLQGTNFPISYPEQKSVLQSYMKMIWKDEFDEKKYVSSKNFIGPNSITLQLVNVGPIDENSASPNIRKNFVVTEKADGDRHLMYIAEDGKVYLINTNMDIIFTGAKTKNEECFNSLLDGELILHDKNGKFINLYAAFDIYYIKKQDIRMYSFMLYETANEDVKSRYEFLKYFNKHFELVSIMDNSAPQPKAVSFKQTLSEIKHKKEFASPIRFTCKEFYPNNLKQSIFEACNVILQKVREGRFEYNTDGLIFSHAFYGVGANEIGKAGPKTKITWENSFKWKPPQFNTVDFLITTVKRRNGDDVIKSYYEDGMNNSAAVQYNDYKIIELRCGFKESKDGYINPCQDIIEDKLPEYSPRFEERDDNDYVPKRFYPTEPYDPNAGETYIMLRPDGSGTPKMFTEENQVFEDNTIVEFRYDLDKEDGWRWIPLRVRYDKTAKLRRGEKEFGNAYKVCNENWKSIHPSGRITEEMICTGQDIPEITISEDKYYNTPAGKFKTASMKDFHNLYVKKRLIQGAAKQGDTLIDFACGKAGDLPKWINAKLSFVFGVDISKDNLENRIDGACARFLNLKKTTKNMPYALFVNGNSAFNIKNGSAMLNEKAKQITAAVFGNGPKEAEKIGRGVARQYGRGVDGFNVSSCQFAMHYFFETPDTLKGFVKNIAECTKQNGYFVGTCYDGKLVFNELKKTKTGESIKIIEEGKKIWEITKGYGGETFEDDSSSIGYRIDVYQESINQVISEYLVNFDYFNRVMSAFGFEVISRDEAKEFGLPEGSGLFSELFIYMLDEISKNKFKAKDYDTAANMTTIEKKISFLNRYFIYKKVRTVNVENVELELGEYNETVALKNEMDTKKAQTVAIEIEKEEKSKKPKVRKLSKKLLLVPATEAVDEPKPVVKSKKSMPDKKEPSSKKPFIVESSSDEE